MYVSNSGFGQAGPYREFKTWGPLAQACCGLAFATGLAGQHPAGIGYSYMDHHGANVMAIAVMAGLLHRNRTGEGQWIDISCTEAGALLNGPALLDYTVNGRPMRRPGSPDSNRSQHPAHGAARHLPVGRRRQLDRHRLPRRSESGQRWPVSSPRTGALTVAGPRCAGRVEGQDELDAAPGRRGPGSRDRFELAAALREVGRARRRRPAARANGSTSDPETSDWGLWPTVTHSKMGEVRVDGIPVHFSKTDWVIARGAPCLGEHNDVVFGDLLGYTERGSPDLSGRRGCCERARVVDGPVRGRSTGCGWSSWRASTVPSPARSWPTSARR